MKSVTMISDSVKKMVDNGCSTEEIVSMIEESIDDTNKLYWKLFGGQDENFSFKGKI